MLAPTLHGLPSRSLGYLTGLTLALLAFGCGSAPVVTSSEGSGTTVTATLGIEHVIFGALEVREHQRLACDLYDHFARLHVEPSFRIARDTRHQNMDSLGRLLRNRESYNLVPSMPRGQFDDPALTAEYARLLAIGSESPAAAFRVAALLEERDVALVRQYASETSASDVTALYSRLERANRAHLSTFVTRLRVLGEAYTPGASSTATLQAALEPDADDE